MLEFRPVKLDQKYAKKWNNTSTDFIHLYKDGVKLRDTLYRVGGMGANTKDGYFMLLKYTEAFYEDSITSDPKRKPHLQSSWCILNTDGIEKVNFKPFSNVYLTGGQVYSIDQNYYNIETNKLYCKSYYAIQSKDFIFLENKYDTDVSKRGVLKINKHDGTYELFK